MHHEMQELGDFRLEIVGMRYRLPVASLPQPSPFGKPSNLIVQGFGESRSGSQDVAVAGSVAPKETAGFHRPRTLKYASLTEGEIVSARRHLKLRGAGGLRFPTLRTSRAIEATIKFAYPRCLRKGRNEAAM